LAKLRRAPESRAGALECQARRAVVLSLVAALEPIVAAINQLERQIATAVREHPDGEIFLSLFRSPRSTVTAATMLAEIGDCRARYPTRDALAGDSGQAAVALESGKRKVACFRWACNKRLRGAFDTLADSTRHWHPWAADHYARALARGHDHPRATRTLGRAWCRVVWSCWQNRTPYDPARHRGLQQHVLVTIPATSGPRPDLAATQRMLSEPVTRRAARRAERDALDGEPTSATALGG
jgi:transposase